MAHQSLSVECISVTAQSWIHDAVCTTDPFLPLQVRSYLMEAGRLHAVRQVLINTSEDALWNLMSSSSNIGSYCTLSQPVSVTGRMRVSLVSGMCPACIPHLAMRLGSVRGTLHAHFAALALKQQGIGVAYAASIMP